MDVLAGRANKIRRQSWRTKMEGDGVRGYRVQDGAKVEEDNGRAMGDESVEKNEGCWRSSKGARRWGGFKVGLEEERKKGKRQRWEEGGGSVGGYVYWQQGDRLGRQ